MRFFLLDARWGHPAVAGGGGPAPRDPAEAQCAHACAHPQVVRGLCVARLSARRSPRPRRTTKSCRARSRSSTCSPSPESRRSTCSARTATSCTSARPRVCLFASPPIPFPASHRGPRANRLCPRTPLPLIGLTRMRHDASSPYTRRRIAPQVHRRLQMVDRPRGVEVVCDASSSLYLPSFVAAPLRFDEQT